MDTTGKGSKDTMAGRQVLDLIAQAVPFSQGVVASTMPRGSVHILQPGKCPEGLFKGYAREYHKEDRVVWQALLKGTPVRAVDCWSASDFDNSPYLHGLLHPNGLRYSMAAPIAAPLHHGYPGAVLLYRATDEGEFSDAEVTKVKNLMKELDEVVIKSRAARNTEVAMNTDPWTHTAAQRIHIFNKDAKPIFPRKDLGLDARVVQQLYQHAKEALEHQRRGQAYADRLLLPDANDELWVFHAAVFKEFTALGQGPVVFFTLQPEAFEWVSVRPTDVVADVELVRLLPTLKFMQQEFHRNPTLDEIARKAHLSPFHFHRRFTDLIGQTPKHFLLSCQIHEAKRLLASRRRELAEIATDCGFAHQSHFTSRFTQATGLTPTRWRRLAAELIKNG